MRPYLLRSRPSNGNALLFGNAERTGLLQTTDWKDEPVQAYVLVYSIDRRSSFRAVLNVMEELREEGNSTPMILAGNKADLERKRAVASNGLSPSRAMMLNQCVQKLSTLC